MYQEHGDLVVVPRPHLAQRALQLAALLRCCPRQSHPDQNPGDLLVEQLLTLRCRHVVLVVLGVHEHHVSALPGVVDERLGIALAEAEGVAISFGDPLLEATVAADEGQDHPDRRHSGNLREHRVLAERHRRAAHRRTSRRRRNRKVSGDLVQTSALRPSVCCA